jgi:diguanylate cyclase (GGDEF)-like protein/PAS domain S-box-containing protein
MKKLLKNRVFRLALIGFLITAVLGLAIASYLSTRFEGEIMGLQKLGDAVFAGSQPAPDGLPAPILERLVLDYQEVAFTAIAGGFVLLFLMLTAIAMHGQRTVVRERSSLQHDNEKLQSSVDKLHHNQERLNQVLNSAGEGICSLDAEGKVTFANQAVTRMTGWKYAELIGRPMHSTLHQPRVDGSPYPEEECPICKTWQLGLDQTVTDEVFWRRNLSSFPVEYVSTPIYDGNQLAGAVVVFRNVTEYRRAAEALRESENFSATIFTSVNEGIIVYDRELRYKAWNTVMEELSGLSSDQIIGKSALDLFPQFMLPGIDRLLIRALRGERVTSQDTHYQVPQTGKEGWMSATFSPHTSPEGETIGVVGIVRDITARKFAEQDLRVSEERYALAANAANDGLWDWDLRGNSVYYSPRWKSMLGYKDGELSSTTEEWFSRVHPEDLPQFNASIGKHIQDETPHFESEHRMLVKDGSYRWMLARGLAMRDPEGEAYRMAGSQTDITERKRAEEQLVFDAFHDGLTGLPNRALFTDRLERALERAKRRDDFKLAVLFLDLDRFKIVNDSLGHMTGDQLLIGAARRLQATLRQVDTVARIGGDEFVILLEDIDDVAHATSSAERIQAQLREPFNLDENEVFTSASIGIAVSKPGYDRADDIMRDADIAMYRAKALGKARHVLFDEAMHGRAVELLQLETDLRKAVERNEFVLHYQPIVELEDSSVIGFEALIRWMHPERGLTYPAAFLPLAEETGLTVELGSWVLREACEQLSRWQRSMPDRQGLWMSVNLSSRQLLRPGLTDEVEQAIRDFQIEPANLALEVTEGIIMDEPEAATSMLVGLRALGVKLPIDDFGTGYSSLAYLHRFPISSLKIDRSFVNRVTDGGEDEVIVRTIVTLAHNLEMDVIAEGIETADQLERLRTLGCEFGQGFYFSEPVPAREATTLLEERSAVPV